MCPENSETLSFRPDRLIVGRMIEIVTWIQPTERNLRERFGRLLGALECSTVLDRTVRKVGALRN